MSLADDNRDNRPTKRQRGPTACEKCRARKTKCDNARPCSYCSKHQFQCVYADDGITEPWNEVGDRVLEAINQLSSSLVKHQHCVSCLRNIDHATNPSFQAIANCSPTSQGTHLSGIDVADQHLDQAPIKAQGTDSILSWPVLASFQSDYVLADDASSYVASESIPDTSRRHLVRLASNYIEGVHTKNPVLDLPDLHRNIAHIAENGLDWSTKTCLVSLVCAIGAIAQKYCDQPISPSNQSVWDTPGLSIDSDRNRQISAEFWTIAVKRLGLAIGGNSVQAVQCLCLAGIYHMHLMQPLQAWKYFNSAAATWTSIMLTHGRSSASLLNNGDSRSFTLMQSLYFTIWKSECELKVELEIPDSILNTIDFPHAFPSPPTPNQSSLATEIAEEEKIWYYYLAEIAARHLINRIIGAMSIDNWPPTTKDIKILVHRARILEAQVHEWQTSLPNMLYFDIPTGFEITAHPDDLTQIIRHRYLTCRELISRPFVRICLETSLDIEQRLRSRVEELASEDVRFCLLKISQVAPHLHQGTWYGIRNLATAVLILSAVHLAKNNLWSPGVQNIVLPTDWKCKSLTAMECFSMLWSTKAGGVSHIHDVLEEILQAVEPT